MSTNTSTTGAQGQDSQALRRRDFLANTAVGLAGLVAVGSAYGASEPPTALLQTRTRASRSFGPAHEKGVTFFDTAEVCRQPN